MLSSKTPVGICRKFERMASEVRVPKEILTDQILCWEWFVCVFSAMPSTPDQCWCQAVCLLWFLRSASSVEGEVCCMATASTMHCPGSVAPLELHRCLSCVEGRRCSLVTHYSIRKHVNCPCKLPYNIIKQ